MAADDCCLILLTILFPPAGVLLASGCGADLVINLCLTFLGFLPGLIHGIYVIMKQGRKQQYVTVAETRPPHGPSTYNPQGSYQPQGTYQPQGSSSYNQPPQPVYNQPPPPPTPSQYQQYPTPGSNPPPPYTKGK